MRLTVFAAITALALAACGQNEQAASAGPDAPAVVSGASAYRLEGRSLVGDAAGQPIVMIRDGERLRIDITTPGGQASVIHNGPDDAVMIMNLAGRTVALRGASDVENPLERWQGELETSATRGGACSALGESGVEWSMTQDGVASTACITADGIVLYGEEGGQRVWETTSIQRGAQPADAFALPPGVPVVDQDDIGAMMRQMGGN